jgi:hypothetical protein
MSAALIAEQQRVALGVITRAAGAMNNGSLALVA